MEMIYQGKIKNDEDGHNALFWSLDNKHQMSVPCDSTLSKALDKMKPGDRVSIQIKVIKA